MKKRKKLMIAAIATGVILVGIGIAIALTSPSQSQTQIVENASSAKTMSGKVTRISNECQHDGICSVTIDDTKMIITGCGLSAESKTCKTFDQSALRVGQQVEVTAIDAGYGTYSLECDTCTIRAKQ